MRIRTILAAAAAPAALAAVLLGTVGQASAATAPHLTGAVELSGVPQYAAFGNIGGPSTGTFSYVNFNQQDTAQTGVWTPLLNRDVALTAHGPSDDYRHILDVDSITPTSSNTYTFTGHGHYDVPGGVTWTSTGSVTGIQGDQFTQNITFGDGSGYTAHDVGVIHQDGSMTGTLTDSLGQSLPWSAPAGSMVPALAYNAGMTPNSVHFDPNGTDATFSSAIPAGHVYAGTPGAAFTITVHDGGNPGTHDTYAQDGTPYQVIGGNLTVH